MAATYQINQGFSFLDNVSATYGVSSTHVGSTPADFDITFFPTSGLSAVNVTNVSFVGSPTYFSSLSAAQTIPYLLLNPATGAASQAIKVGFVYNNTRLHASNENATFSIALCTYADSSYLSADTGETLAPEDSGVQYNTFGPYTLMAYGDAASPSATVTQLSAIAGDRSVLLTWVTPVVGDLSATQIRRNTSPVVLVTDGTLIYSGLLTTFLDQSFPDVYTNNNLYYGAYALDNVGKTSTVATATADPTWGNWDTFEQQQKMRLLGYI